MGAAAAPGAPPLGERLLDAALGLGTEAAKAAAREALHVLTGFTDAASRASLKATRRAGRLRAWLRGGGTGRARARRGGGPAAGDGGARRAGARALRAAERLDWLDRRASSFNALHGAADGARAGEAGGVGREGETGAMGEGLGRRASLADWVEGVGGLEAGEAAMEADGDARRRAAAHAHTGRPAVGGHGASRQARGLLGDAATASERAIEGAAARARSWLLPLAAPRRAAAAALAQSAPQPAPGPCRRRASSYEAARFDELRLRAESVSAAEAAPSGTPLSSLLALASPLAWTRWLSPIAWLLYAWQLAAYFSDGLAELLALHETDEEDITARVIRDAGYPYEQISVTTDDGYVLTLDRLPNKRSRKVVYMQAGLLDSSVGWLTENCVSSPALAAWDRGFDVWLGNFRGWAGARRHVDNEVRNTPWLYWSFGLDDHALGDIPAFMRAIDKTKRAELAAAERPENGMPFQPQVAEREVAQGDDGDNSALAHGLSEKPYSLAIMAHSLGGAAALLYAVHERTHGRPDGIDHLVLCAPAGFHMDVPFFVRVFSLVFGNAVVAPLIVRHVSALYIPSRVLRLLFRKVMLDLEHSMPAASELFGVIVGNLVFGGDGSDWSLGANKRDYMVSRMPGVSIQLLLQLQQSLKTGRFEMRDYGPQENRRRYGSSRPFDVAAHYGALRGLPVDILAGTRDSLTPPRMTKMHYEKLIDKGVEASYQELDFGHLEFAVHVRDRFCHVLLNMLDQHARRD